MALETIEGPVRPIRCIVCAGRTVATGNTMIPVGQPDANGVHHFVPNPQKHTFSPGEELDLSPDDFAHLHSAGFVRRLDEDPAVVRPGSLSFPSGGGVPIGNVKPTAELS